MRLKPGVKITLLRPPMMFALLAAEGVFYRNGSREVVVTSGEDGEHMEKSLHYLGLAVDVRRPDDAMVPFIMRGLREALGPDFDVVDERNHIHIEYDPR